MGVEGRGNPEGVVGNWQQDAANTEKRAAEIARLEEEMRSGKEDAAIANPRTENTEGSADVQAVTNAFRPKREIPQEFTPRISLEGPPMSASLEDPEPEEDGEK